MATARIPPLRWGWIVVLVLAVAAPAARFWLRDPAPPSAVADDAPARRIVSLAPSLTETVFALGAGDRLVGVTRHCRYPEAALALPKIGDYQTPDYEAVVAARPDLALALEEHRPALPKLEKLGVRTVVFDHRSLAGVLASFDVLGRIVERPEAAAALRDRLASAMATGDAPDAPDTRPRVLLILGRDYAAELPRQIFAVGPGNLYHEVLEAAGGRNAYTGAMPFPALGPEDVLTMRPDLVIELLGMEPGLPDADAARAAWTRLFGADRAPAVRVVVGDAAFVPGPRTADFLDDLRRVLAGD